MVQWVAAGVENIQQLFGKDLSDLYYLAGRNANAMKVRCINDDFSNVSPESVGGLVKKVGDPLPVKGQEYDVIGYFHGENDVRAYELDGLDYSNYPGGRLFFLDHRFEVIEDSFTPNHILEDGTMVERVNMYCTFTFDTVPPKRLPRKLKKKMQKQRRQAFTWDHPVQSFLPDPNPRRRPD